MEIETKTTSAVDAGSIAEAEKKSAATQWQGLRRIPDKMPKVAFLILIVEVSFETMHPTNCKL